MIVFSFHFFSFPFKIEVQVTYNVVLVSGVPHSDSAMHVNTYIPFFITCFHFKKNQLLCCFFYFSFSPNVERAQNDILVLPFYDFI